MLIEFENCKVPVWKLRQGTVVGYNDGGIITYFHISAFDFVNEEFCIAHLMVEDISGVNPVLSKHLIWLEP